MNKKFVYQVGNNKKSHQLCLKIVITAIKKWVSDMKHVLQCCI